METGRLGIRVNLNIMILSKFKSIFFALGILTCISLLFSACDEKKNQTKVKLSFQERRAVDTLYKNQVSQLSPLLDSICDANFDERVQSSIDSILYIRREEEALLRKKIPIQK